MLHFEGTKDFSQAPDVLWAKLADARFLAQCIPGAESVSRAEPAMVVFTLRPGLAFVRGTLEITLRVLEAVPATAIRYSVHGTGIGSSNTVEAALTLVPNGAGTRVGWVADIKELGGLLKMVPQGLIKASAQKVIADVWAAVEAQLQAAGS